MVDVLIVQVDHASGDVGRQVHLLSPAERHILPGQQLLQTASTHVLREDTRTLTVVSHSLTVVSQTQSRRPLQHKQLAWAVSEIIHTAQARALTDGRVVHDAANQNSTHSPTAQTKSTHRSHCSSQTLQISLHFTNTRDLTALHITRDLTELHITRDLTAVHKH